MRVLLLNSEYPPIGGGAANATRQLLHALSREDIDVDLVTAGTTSAAATAQYAERIRIFTEPIGQRETTYHVQSHLHLIRYYLRARRRVRALLREQRYDLVHAFFTVPAGRIAFETRRRVPYLISLRGADVPGFSDKYASIYGLLKPFIRQIWHGAGRVVANSEGLRELARVTDPGQEIDIIPNGIDTSMFTPGDRDGAGGTFRLLTVARLTARKGLHLLLPALREEPTWQLTIVGDGEERERLGRQAQALGIADRVQFAGRLQHGELPEIYRAHDLFVLPSSNEGMSNTVLEALASGLPIVTTDTGGAQELITPENGIALASVTPQTLHDVIDRLRADETLRRTAGAASRRIAERFSWEAVAKAYLAHYRAVTR